MLRGIVILGLLIGAMGVTFVMIRRRRSGEKPACCPECGHALPNPASPRCPACGESI